MSYVDMTLSEQIERLKVGWLAAEKETADLRAEVERLRAALQLFAPAVLATPQPKHEETK